MAKKPIQKEEEVEVKVNPNMKKDTFVTRWFKDCTVDNRAELKICCDITARSAQEQFNMYLRENGNTEIYGVIFYATMIAILEYIREKQNNYNNFTIAIANSVNLGYCNNDDEDNEKIGNFMPIMEYIGVNRIVVDTTENINAEKTEKDFIRWKDLNIKKNAEFCKEIQERAFEKIKKEFKTNIRYSEGVIPLFCIFLDNLTSILKMKFKQAEGTDVSEVHINVFGLFDAFYSFNEEDNQEIIEYLPNIPMKMALKSDNIAGRD